MGVSRLGRYTILKHLASGGMADVLLARTEGIEGWHRHVVVKRIRAEHAKDARFIRMFLDEARVAASLHHQHIVTVHDIGDVDGEYFFSMEYLHGEDLRRILSQVSRSGMHLPLAYAISIVSAVAAGLHYAHERRGPDGKPLEIVHRDVSPSNVLVGYDGSVKIVDFGIAKAALRGHEEETRTGSLKGKVAYMSPEQCRGEAVDRRSDVFALGVVLFELATTTRLYKDENEFRAMEAIVHGEVPDPRARRPGLPIELAAIVMRALAKEPDDRFQSADELRVALDQFAAKARYTASPSALATFMQKLFGSRPEPWLEGDAPRGEPPGIELELEVATPSPQAAWGNTPASVRAPVLPDPSLRVKGTTAGKRRMPRGTGSQGSHGSQASHGSHGSSPELGSAMVARSATAPIPPNETQPSEKFGFEQRLLPDPSAKRRALGQVARIGLPMLALGGALAWWIVPRTSAPAPAPVAAAAVTPRPAAPEAPAPPARIDVRIEADAHNARVVFRRRIATLPMTTQIAPNDVVELLEVSAPGYKTERYWLTFDRTTHLRAHLVRGRGIEEATQEQTLVALGEQTPAADGSAPDPAAPAVTADDVRAATHAGEARERAEVPASHRRRIGHAALPDTTVVVEQPSPGPGPAVLPPVAAGTAAAVAPVALPTPLAEAPSAPAAVSARAPAAAQAQARSEPPRTIAPAALARLLVSSTRVEVPDVVQMRMAHDGRRRTTAVLKVCIDTNGAVRSAALLRSSGYATYDERLVEGVRSWRYRPLVVGGRALDACSAVVIAYALP